MLRVVLGSLCLIGCFAATALMLYYFFFTLGGANPDKKRYLPFLGPIAFFIPRFWDEGGNRARGKLFAAILLFGACFSGLALVVNLLPPPIW
jgi:hypothetical protein